MTWRIVLALFLAVGLGCTAFLAAPIPACCPVSLPGKPVVNADQTVIILWDAGRRTQHFIRKASFQSEADDFGFIVPSPSQPDLEESGSEAFPFLAKLTEPEVKTRLRPPSVGCSAHTLVATAPGDASRQWVKVLEEKEVAGFNAAVLEAESAQALVSWLKEHGYAFSPEVEDWAKPYIEARWKFTALKVAKNPGADQARTDKGVSTPSLRISFKTERPLFPYREPDPKSSAQELGAKQRLLRIYFLAEARYQGELTADTPWTGEVAWADKLSHQARQKLLAALKLPGDTGPATLWLTEFEDNWPYRAAPADVYFSRDQNQRALHREPIIQYVSSGWPADASVYCIAAVMFVPFVMRRARSLQVCKS